MTDVLAATGKLSPAVAAQRPSVWHSSEAFSAAGGCPVLARPRECAVEAWGSVLPCVPKWHFPSRPAAPREASLRRPARGALHMLPPLCSVFTVARPIARIRSGSCRPTACGTPPTSRWCRLRPAASAVLRCARALASLRRGRRRHARSGHGRLLASILAPRVPAVSRSPGSSAPALSAHASPLDLTPPGHVT